MRFFKKKFYHEVRCSFCNGKGWFEWIRIKERKDSSEGGQSVIGDCAKIEWCTLCNGRGTQTVLEREE